MNIKQDFIAKSASNRPGTALNATSITIHETANTSTGANAEMHARYVKGPDARSRAVSWHYTVDEKQIIQHLPVNERGWHAGANGNARSIGIEICVNQDGNFNQAKERAAGLVRKLMSELGINLNDVVTHKHWTGKNCPARLLNEWSAFKSLISNTSTPSKPAPSTNNTAGTVKVITDSLWVYDKKDWNARHQTVGKNEIFTVVKEHIVNGSKMYELKSGLFITANKQYVKFTPTSKPTPKPTKEYVQLPKSVSAWNAYPLNKKPTRGNEDLVLNPKKFEGLEYEVLGRPYPNVVTINTSNKGRRNIYVGPDTSAKFVKK